MDADEAENRPAIGAARLEAMFDGLRRDVVLGVPAPESAEVVRRGVRRRQRRRTGVVAGVGVLGVAVLWTVATVVPLRTGHQGVAGVPVEQSALPRPKPVETLALPPAPSVPALPSGSPGPGTVVRVSEALPLHAADLEVRALALGVNRLPNVLGGYGPWSVVGAFSGESGSPSPGASPSASSGTAASPSTSATTSASASAGGSAQSGQAVPSGTRGTVFADGCVPRLVLMAGAGEVWGESYTDGGDAAPTADQYVLRFGSEADAEVAGARLLQGGECVAPGSGWTVEDRNVGVVALGMRQPVVAAEEVAVHVRGSLVAVLVVRRGGRGVAPEAGASEPFRAAAAEFLTLGLASPSMVLASPLP
ncbi:MULTISPECIES: hypothetical protein [Kitasatospora]|uniref:Uncharacterized protein n=1 Tax=Kitasatospora setae (strain ATCC 33774 / DSM 43861 / JCM 3304 / KCC A-0304 / NBRC 14216 / KM-6054) TaxID=452652 RepID=E4NBA1_KITSK|nr:MULTISPECIES: hypothetical protein [Kitasatospora]BAJ28482.1 hypothetical protein KSE_26710 [Kitasatospora setae KM-6054]